MQAHESPRLLVEWSSPGREFLSSIKPALSRSERQLAGEAPFGLIPLRIMIPSYVLEAFVIFAAIFIQIKVEELRPYVVPRLQSHEVIYYTGDELPRTEDLRGAEAGTSGRVGGEEAYHRTQTIKVARGGSLVPEVVDAPNLKLTPSHDPVANLLAVRPDAGPPPVEGVRSSRAPQNLAAVVPPAPDVVRDYTRNGVELNSVIAPAPAVTREQPLVAPNLNTVLIAPAPNVADNRQLVAPVLVPAVVPPAPGVTRDRSRSAAALNPSVVAPAPSVTRENSRAAQTLAANVIPPAPTANAPEISRAPVQMTNPSVVPPPVSAPERATTRTSKLTMPTPSVVAPPPSADITSDARRRTGGAAPDPTRSVVPPPPSQSGGSFMGNLIGKIFGPSEVVPPPPAVNSRERSGSASLASNVVPPPPVSAASQDGSSRTRGTGTGMVSNVVAPPPSAGVDGGIGDRSRNVAAPYAGSTSVVPPPPSVSGVRGGTGNNGGAAWAGGTLAGNVVPPPPSVGGGSATTGSGLGHRGEGLGAPSDVGAALTAAAKNGGSGSNAGAVISSQPGSKVGLPTSGGAGSLAMSPTGGDKAGIGGNGGGAGISRGNGPGSGMTGAGSGAAKSGLGHGADANARAGISPASGPGGAGSAASGTPAVRGVDISGGSSIVTLPGFGTDPAANEPSAPGRSSLKQRQELNVTVVATATSGGAFEPYKNLLHGEKYTTYVETSLGTVVMEFSDESPSARAFGGTLAAPVAIRTDLADGLPKARMVVTCKLDAYGNLKNVRVLEAGPAAMTAKIVAALRSWKFQPAMKGDQPVEVTAILGFGIDTNDRF